MLAFLLSILPESFWILIIAFAGIGLMLGIISRQVAFGIIGIIILRALLMPFVDSLFDALPLWVLILLMIGFWFWLIRWGFSLLLGKRTADHFVAMILHDIFLLPFKLIKFLVRRRT